MSKAGHLKNGVKKILMERNRMSPQGSGNLWTAEENVKYILVEEEKMHLISIFFCQKH